MSATAFTVDWGAALPRPQRHSATAAAIAHAQRSLKYLALCSLRTVIEPTSVLEHLRHDRTSLAGELATLNASSARLHETASAEAAVLAEIGAMGSAEIAAMSKWASDGCTGEMPAPDLKLRRALAEKLATAQAAATAAKGAGADIDHQISELNDKLHAIGAQIEQTIWNTFEIEHDAVVTEYRTICDKVCSLEKSPA